MHKVINLQERVQEINNKKIEIDIKMKKALNKKTTFHLSYYEIFVLIKELTDVLSLHNDLASDIINNEFFDYGSIEMYKSSSLHITRLVKKLYKAYLDNNCFLDSKIQLSLSDLEIFIEALEMTCNPFINIHKDKNGKLRIDDKYETLDRYYKTSFYFYNIFENARNSIIEKAEELRKQSLTKKERKQYNDIKNLKESIESSEYYKAESMLYNRYKDHYIKEFRSKVQFIYEVTTYIGDHALWGRYFVKGNPKFNKSMVKYYYHRESPKFAYFDEAEIGYDKESNSDISYLPQGWRYLADVISEEEYEEYEDKFFDEDNEEYEDCADILDYEEYALFKLEEAIKNSEEMQGFEFEILNQEEKYIKHLEFEFLNERLLDTFEIVIEEFCDEDNALFPDGKIADEFDKIISLCYQLV